MQIIMEHAAAKKMPGIRLAQNAFHSRSLCLYTRLGFMTRELQPMRRREFVMLRGDGERL